MTAVLTEIINLLVGGISGVATGIGSGLSTLASAIFLVESSGTYSLSVMGALIAIFGGVSLAIGLGRWVLNFCTSFGQRNR